MKYEMCPTLTHQCEVKKEPVTFRYMLRMDDMLEYHDPELGWEVNASPIKRIEAGLVGQVALFKDILGDLINASVVQARNPIDQREIRFIK